MGNRTYQTFLIGPNRFRALLPTTPLDQPGTVQVRADGGGESGNIAVKLKT